MKKKYLNKKLQINKETVSNLNFYEMKKIAGGGDTETLGDTATLNITELNDLRTTYATGATCATCVCVATYASECDVTFTCRETK
jgi:hypothetical protein